VAREKSTLLRVLAGLYSPERIALSIDEGAILRRTDISRNLPESHRNPDPSGR